MGVVYVGHIPHHFQEKEMRQFFEQFGDILKLRISRSKKVSCTPPTLLDHGPGNRESLLAILGLPRELAIVLVYCIVGT